MIYGYFTSLVLVWSSCSQISVALSPVTPRFYLAAMEKNWEKTWDQNYVTDRKWWTRFVLTEPTISSPDLGSKLHHGPEMVDSVCFN